MGSEGQIERRGVDCTFSVRASFDCTFYFTMSETQRESVERGIALANYHQIMRYMGLVIRFNIIEPLGGLNKSTHSEQFFYYLLLIIKLIIKLDNYPGFS